MQHQHYLSAIINDIPNFSFDFLSPLKESYQNRKQLKDENRLLKAQIFLLHEQLRRDPMTDLLNKKGIEEELEKYMHAHVNHCRRQDIKEKKSFDNDDDERFNMLLYIDLCHFKKINDQYGHEAGDRAICLASNILKLNTRKSDLIARMGGDEFCVFLKNINEKDTKAKILRMQDAFLKAHLPVQNIKTGRKDIIFLKASIGFSAGKNCSTVHGWIKQADQSMYQNKAIHSS
jgi:diguanylate cyclase (GGDEF)-like protein